MAQNCASCGSESVEYIPEAVANICQDCGTLANPDQIELRAQSPTDHNGSQVEGLTWYNGPSLLRTANGKRILQGQSSKEVTHKRNTAAAHDYIDKLLNSMGQKGLSSRVKNIFDLCYRTGRFLWGRRATLVIGASTYIALREAKKVEMLRDIACRISAPPSALSQTFMLVNNILKTSLPPSEASSLIPLLIQHISLLLSPNSTPPLPSRLRTYLSPISLPAVQTLACSLFLFTERISLNENRRSGAVASALLIAALEAESRNPVPCLGTLVSALAKRVGVNKRTVEERYHEVGLMIEDFKSCLVWVTPSIAPPNTQKRKLLDRADNAKWIKDILRFQEDFFSSGSTSSSSDDLHDGVLDGVPNFCSHGDSSSPECSQIRCDKGPSSSLIVGPGHFAPVIHDKDIKDSNEPHIRKKLRIELDNSSTRPTAYVKGRRGLNDEKVKQGLDAAGRCIFGDMAAARFHCAGMPSSNRPSVTAQLLTSQLPCTARTPAARPTRLQILGAFKGESNVDDEELFEADELESFIRSAEEVEAIQVHWNQTHGPEEDLRQDGHDQKAFSTSPTRKRKRIGNDVDLNDLDLIGQLGIADSLLDDWAAKAREEKADLLVSFNRIGHDEYGWTESVQSGELGTGWWDDDDDKEDEESNNFR